MQHKDLLYGYWPVPDYIQKLIGTKEMIRPRGITQTVIPNSVTACGTLPSRFHHGLGVCRLALEVIKRNPHLKDYALTLPVAALFHDAGNSPFSHRGEIILKEVTAKNGETFLEDILDGSEASRVMKSFGISVETVVALVTGKLKPISDVLHGSMDLDNIDNVARFFVAANLGRNKGFDPLRLARAFRFSEQDQEWRLPLRCLPEVRRWQKARAITYSAIYSPIHLSPAMMVYRALELAFLYGEISRDFFFLDDSQAIAYLGSEKCNARSRYLIERVLRWDWYQEIVSIEQTEPSAGLFEVTQYPLAGAGLANQIAGQLLVAGGRAPIEKVAVYIEKGRDKRQITLPFVDGDGYKTLDTSDAKPIYRLKVFIAPELICAKGTKEAIQSFVDFYLQAPWGYRS